MASGGDRGRRLGLVAVATAASAVAIYFGSGLQPLPWLTWLAFVPLLLVAPRVAPLAAAGSAFAAWMLGTANMWSYLLSVLDLPVSVPIGFLGAQALILAGAVVLYRALVVRGRPLLAAVAAGAAWAGGDYAFSLVSPHGTFGSLAYSQADVTPVVQVVSVTGLWGIDFLLLAAPAVLAAAFAPGVGGWAVGRLGLALVVLTAAVLSFGLTRPADPDASNTRQVALITVDRSDADLVADSPEGRDLLDRLANQVAGAAADGADLVVLPEANVVTDAASRPEVETKLSTVAQHNDVDVVAGLIALGGPGTGDDDYNVAMYFPADGSASVTYRKHHPIPGVEEVQPGDGDAIVASAGTALGIQICKDMDFPAQSRSYAEQGVGLLAVPAWDFSWDSGSDDWLHSRMATLRGVENGFSLARTSRDGLLSITDAYGRVVAEASGVGDAPAVVVSGTVDTAPVGTVYTRLGDWFAWVCVGLTLIGAGFAVRRRTDAAADPAEAPGPVSAPEPARR